MAKVRLSSSLEGISGKIDGYVFKVYRGKPVLSKKPTFTKPWSQDQGAWRKTFAEASCFAKTIKADSVLCEAYRRRGRRMKLNYRQMALRDCFHPPEVVRLDTSKYTPADGGALAILAKDDFEVTGVHVALRDAAGVITVSGEAALVAGMWRFNTPPSDAKKVPVSVDVVARDRPGNATSKTFFL